MANLHLYLEDAFEVLNISECLALSFRLFRVNSLQFVRRTPVIAKRLLMRFLS
jgi:hypothetical protein